MKIAVTGAAGFIGAALARALAARTELYDAEGRAIPVSRIVLADRVLPESVSFDARIQTVQGDIADPAFVSGLIDAGTRVVFHLAGVMSGACEADFALGLRVNLDGTRNVFEACRALPDPVRLVFSSSIGVFGTPLPLRIDDDTPQRPTLSYGAQKRACEILLEDYSRRGFLDGRALRLPGIVVRPRLPNGALSAFNSDLIREPLAGRAYAAPVGPEAVVWLMSAERCVANLIHAALLPQGAIGSPCVLNLPCIAASAGEIVAAIGRAGGAAAAARVSYAPDPKLQAQFGGWPRDFHAGRALALGFAADASLDAIIRFHLDTL
ncbi:MAG: NAD-dependent epimerase/dehydratase family protein [Proteobacteria bacterium]|nr:NAD-dependent epimerase/dehydratase family protein [Pseudomonadota bacterium]